MTDDLAQLTQVFRAVALAIFADGEPSAEELTLLRRLMAEHPAITERYQPADLVRETYRLIKEMGATALLDEIVSGILERELQELAYVLVSRVVSTDGDTAEGEAVILNTLREAFGFSAADVLELLAR